MTKEDKDLLLKDLCARLPYGVKCEYYDCCKGDYDKGTIRGFERQEYMQIAAVLIGVVIIALFILCIHLNNEKESYSAGIFCGWAMTSLLIIEMICICECVSKPHPKAMDVYQGKTTLEYTIRDGVKIDSIVVFKNKNYDKR